MTEPSPGRTGRMIPHITHSIPPLLRADVAGKDFTFEDQGEVELKGFDQPVRAWAVAWDR